MVEQTEIQIHIPTTIKLICCDKPLKQFNHGGVFCGECLKKYEINQKL